MLIDDVYLGYSNKTHPSAAQNLAASSQCVTSVAFCVDTVTRHQRPVHCAQPGFFYKSEKYEARLMEVHRGSGYNP